MFNAKWEKVDTDCQVWGKLHDFKDIWQGKQPVTATVI